MIFVFLYNFNAIYTNIIKNKPISSYSRTKSKFEMLPVEIKEKNNPKAINFLSSFIKLKSLYIKKKEKIKNIRFRYNECFVIV